MLGQALDRAQIVTHRLRMSIRPKPDVICVGAVLWDVIGRTERVMKLGNDVPGRIARSPGGVALNIAIALRRAGLAPTLLSVVGQDSEGADLLQACQNLNLETTHVLRSSELRTDRYLAVEDAQGLVAAIADTLSLELAGSRILAPLQDGRLGTSRDPWRGFIAVDGNLTPELLREIAASPAFAAADLRVAPASPGKAERLRPLLRHPRATFYVNREEASLLCGQHFENAPSAAQGLLAHGAPRAIVTDAAHACCDAMRDHPTFLAQPPTITVRRVTGAGDTLLAAHIAAEARGADRATALAEAVRMASAHVAGEITS